MNRGYGNPPNSNGQILSSIENKVLPGGVNDLNSHESNNGQVFKHSSQVSMNTKASLNGQFSSKGQSFSNYGAKKARGGGNENQILTGTHNMPGHSSSYFHNE
ncbi:MAG: hypothetical protein GY809_27140 [Planctomycetes bacterium]|nr:hypothetical protein [Planctomycetota bacterium]